MSFDSAPIRPLTNKIFASLSEKDLAAAKQKIEVFALNFGEKIYEAGDEIKYVYFPDSGIISLLATLDEESVLEVGIVGREGIIGISTFLGTQKSHNRAIVQGEGVARRMKTADFLALSESSTTFTRVLLNFVQSLMTQISQSAVCYRFHKLDARLARWLLMTADCMESDEFQLTQDFLSHMLGVRREGVTLAAHRLQDDGIIQYSRGNIEILKRKSLESASCPCYEILKKDRIATEKRNSKRKVVGQDF